MLDTNILLRLFDDRADPRSTVAARSVSTLSDEGALYYASQNIGECWNTLTRPTDRNGFGLTPIQAAARIHIIEERFVLLPDGVAVHREWLRLLTRYQVSGSKVHDAHLVATMLVHGVSRVLTFNTADFARFTEVQAVHPQEVVHATS